MGAYMYPITIKREPQVIKFNKVYELESDELTLDLLNKYVGKDDFFKIHESLEDGPFPCGTTYLTVFKKRMETPEEVAARVAKEEQYMANYAEFHKTGKLPVNRNK